MVRVAGANPCRDGCLLKPTHPNMVHCRRIAVDGDALLDVLCSGQAGQVAKKLGAWRGQEIPIQFPKQYGRQLGMQAGQGCLDGLLTCARVSVDAADEI